MEDNAADIRLLVCQRIGEVETAMKSLQGLRKTLLHKAHEAKQSILTAFLSERDSMQNKEISLLMEVDNLLHSKDDALVTQLSKLNQVLGCLRNCLESPHPCGDCLEKFEDIDMLSVKDVSLEFSSANEKLKDSIKSYTWFSSSVAGQPAFPAADYPEDNMTKWLLTPSNNHHCDAETRQGRQELISTEWLLQYHASTSTGVEVEDHFNSVRSDENDEWLNEDRSTPSSLYVYAAKHFDSLTFQNQQDWLHQATPGEKCSLSDSESEASDTLSQLSSSCVMIPSITSSEGSSKPFMFLEGAWPSDISPGLQSPHEVREWVATCQRDNMVDWLVDSRERKSSINSFSILSTEGNEDTSITDTSHWLAQPLTTSTTGSVLNQVSNTWLVNRGSTCTPSSDSRGSLADDWPSSSSQIDLENTDAWLSIIRSKMEQLDTTDEKCDESFEKGVDDWLAKSSSTQESERSCDEWLQLGTDGESKEWLTQYSSPKSMSYQTNNWLTGEEKRDEPETKRAAFPKSDEEWLLVKDQLRIIASSDNCNWLLEAENDCGKMFRTCFADNRERSLDNCL